MHHSQIMCSSFPFKMANEMSICGFAPPLSIVWINFIFVGFSKSKVVITTVYLNRLIFVLAHIKTLYRFQPVIPPENGLSLYPYPHIFLNSHQYSGDDICPLKSSRKGSRERLLCALSKVICHPRSFSYWLQLCIRLVLQNK